MVFLHHPAVWDASKDSDNAFYQINVNLLEALKERRISLFNFHVPLDHFGVYATSKTLAERLGISIDGTFAEYYGAQCGVIGTTDCKNVQELSEKYAQTVGHKTKLYQYGESAISAEKVAVAAGGGTDTFVLSELVEKGIDVLITGVTLDNKYTRAAHEMARENAINILGGTHYSSEKFAWMEVCKYFDGLGLPATFVEDAPCFEDM
jgi:putative NIF3 family GTP cyclohydrolase 1 type 2